jgi:arylsulfatase A-like enzyme
VGLFENTLLIITSDHGENFGDHGLASHQFCLYDSLMHVPLIISYPKLIPSERRISSLVSHIDILPTILDLLNIKAYPHGIQGKSLSPFENRKIHNFVCAECGESVLSRLEASSLRSKLKVYDKGSKCLRTESYKYIISADQKEELYDLHNDPLETINIAMEYPDKAKYFKEQLENAIDISFFGPKEIPLTKERDDILKRLQSMGYI